MQEVAAAVSNITATSDVDRSTYLVTSSIIEDLTESAIEDVEVRYACIKKDCLMLVNTYDTDEDISLHLFCHRAKE